ncbi:RrF2 family transcriptional regulator [Ornithinimicrobium tianjinense]|uniref:Transcriptional regulator, BadM/Rrf2 family n=1 Tax=Ornithinimicrobium tianjinense TaxID=1195761 RepID=A0A917BXI1_9MICO|nr:Rrf2 family transcriptional regulator [Ornithinimicrobium tianjinense]GGF60102.1 hypothetical protein GCM10011366_29920 [Ornithinimicrobium tianjinense]
MNITARSEYAVRAVLAIAAAQAGPGGTGDGGTGDGAAIPVSVERLVTVQQLPRKFLEGILADLRRAGLVVSRRGAAGGYLLARPEEAISVGDIIRAVDGPLAEVRGLRPHETAYQGEAEHLPTLWVGVRAALREVLDGTSVVQLRTGELPEVVRRLTASPEAWRNHPAAPSHNDGS